MLITHTASRIPEPSFCIQSLGEFTSDASHFQTCEARNTLHDFQLSQMKDWHRETIVAISLIVAPNWWSCVVQWERFKDGRCHGLATKDTIQHDHHTVCLLLWHTFTDQPIKMWHGINATWPLKHKTAYLKLLCLLLSRASTFFRHT